MEIWIDAQLSPSLALWINQHYSAIVIAHSILALGLRDAEDKVIYEKARAQGVVLMSKDADFVKLLDSLGLLPN